MKDLYEIMGLSRTATAEEIAKAYRKLAVKYHPDKNPGDKKAEELFKEINNAYEILSDESKRRHYDTYGEAPSQRQARNPFHSNKPFTNFMDDLFGNFSNFQAENQRQDHIHTEVFITLEQAYNGGEAEVQFERHVNCKKCHGAGGTLATCAQCNGSGFRVIIGEAHTIRTICHICSGNGKILKDQCDACDQGVAEIKKDVHKFKIPPGVETGMRFVHSGLGNQSIDGQNNGNLYVTVRVTEHDLFKRLPNGNIFLEAPVSYAQLALGDEIELPTIGGKLVEFKIPKGTQDGAKFRLAQMGMPIFNNGMDTYRWGDQLVQVRLEIPTQFTDEQIKLIENLAEFEKSNVTPLRKKFLEMLEKYDER